MKTINTTLPVYDRLSKQCYERAGKDTVIGAVPTPRFRLPSMQWNVEDDDPGAISMVELIDINGDSFTSTHPFSSWTNVSYGTFASNGLEITNAIGGAGAQYATGGTYSATATESIRFRGLITLTSGAAPTIQLVGGGPHGSPSHNLVDGYNDFTLTLEDDVDYVLNIVQASFAGTWSFTGVIIESSNINAYFVTLPALFTDLTDKYFQYKGDTLNYLLDPGIYYLKMTTVNDFIYYSEWFEVTCIYPNLITGWTNSTFDSFTSVGTRISSAVETTSGLAISNTPNFWLTSGETINVYFFLTLNSGTLPQVRLRHVTLVSTVDTENAVEGLNEIILTATSPGYYQIIMYATAAVSFNTSEMLFSRSYSEKYTRIDFSNTCDLGDILYADDFEQTLWIESELMEATFQMTPEGSEDGNGLFIPTFRRQDKLQLIRTPLITQVMVECLYRLMLHDTITIIDLVGDTWTVKSLETEHEWQGTDNYYALAVLTVDLDTVFVIGGCCNNIT